MGLPHVETFSPDLAEGHGGKPVSWRVNWMDRAADTWSFSGSAA